MAKLPAEQLVQGEKREGANLMSAEMEAVAVESVPDRATALPRQPAVQEELEVNLKLAALEGLVVEEKPVQYYLPLINNGLKKNICQH